MKKGLPGIPADNRNRYRYSIPKDQYLRAMHLLTEAYGEGKGEATFDHLILTYEQADFLKSAGYNIKLDNKLKLDEIHTSFKPSFDLLD